MAPHRLWIVPAIAIGTWAARLWHQYVTDVGCTLWWRPNSSLVLVSTAAIGLGVLLLIGSLLRPASEPALAMARVAHRAHTIAGASLTVAAIIASLVISERLVPRGACVVSEDEWDGAPIPEEETAAAQRCPSHPDGESHWRFL